jgi:prepilin-type processing-associated H-X9-DG protein
MERRPRYAVRAAATRAGVLATLFVIALALVFIPIVLLRVRESSHRAQCSYNLHQLGIAASLHLMALNHLPDGGGLSVAPRTWDGTEPARAPGQEWGWGYQILPHLNQEALWTKAQEKRADRKDILGSRGEFYSAWIDRSDAGVRRTANRFFFCPSRRKPVVADGWAKSDYAGNGGLDTENGVDGVIIRRLSARPVGLDGYDGWSDWLRQPRGIPDGAAQTILFAEKAFDGSGYGDQLGYSSGFGVDTIRWCAASPVRDGVKLESGLFGSAHPDAVNALFVDGSVRPIRFGVEVSVFRGLCLRADGTLSAPRSTQPILP